MRRFITASLANYSYNVRREISSQATIKKFYKNVSIANGESSDKTNSETDFEILLDTRRLRTPCGNNFRIQNLDLALAVANEWDFQRNTIERYTMPLTNLCNIVLDNPTERKKETVVDGIMEFADTDTICFRVDSPEELQLQQDTEWGDVLNYIEKQYGCRPPITSSFALPHLPTEFREFISRHLLSYNQWGLVGLQACVETLKSVWLALAMVDGFISSERAVALSRLEQAFQEKRWGSVSWLHDVEVVELNSRVSSALILVLTSHARHSIKKKLSSPAA